MVALLLVTGILPACQSREAESMAGGLPSDGHVHALRSTGDDGLLLGLHGALWRSDPAAPARVYAFVVGHGLHVSEDAGDTWTAAAPVGEQLPEDVATMSVSPDDGRTVLVGSPGLGVFRSVDGGNTFVRIFDTGTVGLVHGPDDRVVAATISGVEASEDGGESWELLVPADRLAGQAIAVAMGSEGSVWVITDQARVLYQDGGDETVEEIARA